MAIALGVAVSTAGRRDLAPLLQSVPPGVPVTVAWQCADDPPPLFRSDGERLRVVRSSGGVSQGRNDAVAELGEVDYLLFPNDDTFYPDGFFDRVEDGLVDVGEPTVGLFDLQDVEGGRRVGIERWGEVSGGDSLRVLRCAHEPRLVVERRFFLRVGGFDTRLGVGSSSILQAGEGADLVAKAVISGARVRDLAADICALELPRQREGEQFAQKRAKYLPGAAWVLGAHPRLHGRTRALARLTIGAVLRSRDARVIWLALEGYRRGCADARRTDSRHL